MCNIAWVSHGLGRETTHISYLTAWHSSAAYAAPFAPHFVPPPVPAAELRANDPAGHETLPVLDNDDADIDIDICLLSPMQRKICSFFQPTQRYARLAPPSSPTFLRPRFIVAVERTCVSLCCLWPPWGRAQRKTHACNLLFRRRFTPRFPLVFQHTLTVKIANIFVRDFNDIVQLFAPINILEKIVKWFERLVRLGSTAKPVGVVKHIVLFSMREFYF